MAGFIAAALIGTFAIFMGARGDKTARDDLSGERSPASAHPAQAQESYLRGVNAWSERSKEGLDTAVVYFRRAIELDPAYADAYAGLANAYVLLGYSGYRPADAMFPKAKAAALRSIQLDSTLAAPYAAMGMELTGERNFREAEAAYRTAIARDPQYATAHQWYGILLMILGRVPEAVDQTRRAAELDPLSLQIQNTYATFLSASGQHEAALRHYQKVAGEEPDSAWVRRNPWLLTNMASVYRENRQYDKALRFARQSVEIAPHHPRPLLALASTFIAMGRPEIARQVFARADTLNEQYASYRALMYLAQGKADSAFVWFDRVKEWGIPILISLQTSRELNQLRDDPRRRALFNRLGLPP
jgi:tetratricopeptide (TPR) repeat protein